MALCQEGRGHIADLLGGRCLLQVDKEAALRDDAAVSHGALDHVAVPDHALEECTAQYCSAVQRVSLAVRKAPLQCHAIHDEEHIHEAEKPTICWSATHVENAIDVVFYQLVSALCSTLVLVVRFRLPVITDDVT